MTAGFVFAPARPMRRAVSCLATDAALALGSSLALAQAPAPTVPAPKATPRPIQPAQKAPAPAKQPAQAPQAPAADQQAAAPPADQPPIVYSPWTKFCGKDNNPTAKEVCLTVATGDQRIYANLLLTIGVVKPPKYQVADNSC